MKTKTEVAANRTKTTKEILTRFEILDVNDDLIQISMSRGEFVQLRESLDRLVFFSQNRIEDKQNTLNKVFHRVLINSNNYLSDNLETLKYYNELTTALASGSQFVEHFGDAVRTHADTF